VNDRRIKPSLLTLLACAGLLALSPAARAHGGGGGGDDPMREVQKAFDAKEWDKAEQILRRAIAQTKDGWVPRYNLALLYGSLDRDEEAGAELLQAIDAGFFDLRRIRRERSFVGALKAPAIAERTSRWPSVLKEQSERTLAALQRTLGPKGDVTRSSRLKLLFLSYADARSTQRAKDELGQLTEWANIHAFPGLLDPQESALDPVTVVAVPTYDAFKKWIRERWHTEHGTASERVVKDPAKEGLRDTKPARRGVSTTVTEQVGGLYDAERVRLVSSDLGSSLRHEFFHALHWRMQTRLGQDHPIWIKEGLASLVEDMDEVGGSLAPVPSWRTNIAKRLLQAGALPDIKDMLPLTPQVFSTQRPLAKYAHARSLFLYLWELDKLTTFWEIYTQDADVGYTADLSGAKALEKVTGRTMKLLEVDFRAWLRELPSVAEEIEPGMASLGVSVESGQDGVLVTEVRAEVSPNRSRAPRTTIQVLAPLQTGDVILAIDNRTVRDVAELIRILSGYSPGDRVRVLYRRLGDERDILVTLKAKE
jgi:hypothetical protein